MGRFLNPDNNAFQTALNSEIYVDKTELIAYTNKVINTKQAFICNSRPRRFGKSITADMLTAYYSKGCDSEDMFASLKIAGIDSFKMRKSDWNLLLQQKTKSGVNCLILSSNQGNYSMQHWKWKRKKLMHKNSYKKRNELLGNNLLSSSLMCK